MHGVLEALEKFIFMSEPTDVDRSKCSVLVIDDDEILVDSLSALLREAGFHVLTSTDGHKGLITLHSTLQNIDVVILDYNMPHCNGEQALTYLRKINPDVKVVGLTGMSNMQLPPGYRWEVDRLVEKPFTSADLIQCLIEVVPSNGNPKEKAPIQMPIGLENTTNYHRGKGKDHLATFVRKGMLSGKEAARVKMLASIAPEKGDEVIHLLTDLIELYDSGVITLIEFVPKKERILASYCVI